MKKILAVIWLAFLTMPLFCEVVKSDVLTSRYGISYAERQRSNYIQKDGYSFSYLGNGTWDVKALNQSANSAKTNNTTKNSEISPLMILLLVIIAIVIVIGVCVSNITTAVAKNSGMDDASAKKVGNSAGVLAGTAAAIAAVVAAILLGKSVETDNRRKRY